jgi:hypothetical protein
MAGIWDFWVCGTNRHDRPSGLDVASVCLGLERGIETARQHIEWLAKALLALYGADVSTTSEIRIKQCFGCDRRLRAAGQIISSWTDDLGTFDILQLVSLAGLTVNDVFSGSHIDDDYWLSRWWDTEIPDDENLSQFLWDVRILYGPEIESDCRRLFNSIRRRFTDSPSAIRAILRHDFGPAAEWFNSALKFEGEFGGNWSWGQL